MDVSKWYFLAWWTLPTMGRFLCFLFPLGWFNWGTIQNYAPHLPPKFKLVDSKKEQTCGSKRTPDFWLPGCHLFFFWKFYIQWSIIIFLIQIAILQAIPYFQTQRHSVGYIPIFDGCSTESIASPTLGDVFSALFLPKINTSRWGPLNLLPHRGRSLFYI